MNYKNRGGVGSHQIHSRLLLSQLDELLKLKPDLLNHNKFVNAYLTRLQPNDDVDWLHNTAQHKAYLERQWAFVSKLGPVHNSLKAHVLFHRLQLDRTQGVYDKDRFMTYIKLPRSVSYINPKYMVLEQSRRYPCNLNQNFQLITLLPAVGNDEPLVRQYLHHFFLKETTYKPYQDYIDNTYLKHHLAETKIVNGLGDPEQWYSLLPPAMYQSLKQRIDLDFAATRKEIYAAGDEVTLDLYVKNVKTLIVNVYEINTYNYYRENLKQVNTNINLDGLVANKQQIFNYKEPALRRVKRNFKFPTINKPGVYVVDFIGNGKSSRVVVRKGQLRHLVRTGTAGQVFTILDESNELVPKATLWMAGTEYKSSKNGRIIVPFSAQPKTQPIILSHDGLSSLQNFSHQSENYALNAGIFVDRQSLLKRKKASVVIRSGLKLNGTHVTLSVLENIKLTISSVDHDGVSTSKEVSDFKLYEDRESVFEFQVPERLSKIQFTLTAQVQNASQNKKNTLTSAQSFTLNQIDRTEKVDDFHFAKIDGLYYIDLLGKTGEVKPERPVHLVIKHRDFRNSVNVSLQTNNGGRITLGALKDIASVTANGPEGVSKKWNLLIDQHTQYQTLHAASGETISVPYMGTADKPVRADFSLLELRGNAFVIDQFKALSIKDGLLQVSDLPQGDYDLLLKRTGKRIRLKLTAGEKKAGYVLSQNRHLEQRGNKPLQISNVVADKKSLTVNLANTSKFTRVHLFATRYHPEFDSYQYFSQVQDAGPYTIRVPKQLSLYVEGRNIGDEYRYIIDRKYVTKYPGNMLNRPSLLLNPWAIRKTETDQQSAAAGDNFGVQPESTPSESNRPASGKGQAAVTANFANLDFLANASSVLLNLKPNDKGQVVIDLKNIGVNQQLHFVAIDPASTTYRTVSLAEIKTKNSDLRLITGLDPKQHFTQQKQISVVPAEGEFVISDISTARFEAYNQLGKIYQMYATLSGNANLVEFDFILNWHKLTEDEKQEKYSKYACHELNFFLYKKDPKFFKSAVQPYLRNKTHKTFMDDWLIDANLSSYLLPWNHEQLNVVERILLAQKIKNESQLTSRHVTDLFNLIPPNIDKYNHLFDTAIKGSALESKSEFGFAGQKDKLEEIRSFNAPLVSMPSSSNAPAPAPGGFGGGGGVRDEKLSFKSKNNTLGLEMAKRRSLSPGKKMEMRQLAEQEVEDAFYDKDFSGTANVRQLYQKLDKTQEWIENNYYKLPIEQQIASLVSVNAFWKDYADHQGDGPFFSSEFAAASRNFTEMMFALSVLDIPLESGEHKTKFDQAKMTLTADTPMIVFHEEIKPTNTKVESTPILVSQNFFRNSDRYRHENNERLDKYVTDEFLVHTVYGCQIVVTNPTSSPQKLDLLLQVPIGSMSVLNSKSTRNVHLNLQPYNTQTIEYYFYFPAAGKFDHYPVHASKNELLLASADPVKLNVVKKLSNLDKESWDYVSQNGSSEDVLSYLKEYNLNRTTLDKIAFRMDDEKYFQQVTQLLQKRHVYNHTLWSYGIKHNSLPEVNQYLQHSNNFVNQCGMYIDSPALTIDPVVRRSYQHMDYRPLVNARAHQLGRTRQILNNRFHQQYHRLLKVLSYRRELNAEDKMSLTYYMLLQDRIGEAITLFDSVEKENLSSDLQYDYFTTYLNFYEDDHKQAREVLKKYAEYPVDRWRDAFASVKVQLDEIEGKAFEVIDEENRTQQQTNLAATQASFEFQVEAKKVRIDYQNLSKVQVNYYLMDIELLFSRNPFVQKYSGQFSNIRPNSSKQIVLPQNKKVFTYDLPEELQTSNVLIEIVAAGKTKTQAYYSNSLKVQLISNYGHLRVTESEEGKPLSKVYVKVYAQRKDGQVKFFKDGYTDLRGRFDYTSLNTNELDFVDKLSLLILSEDHGAVVREVQPPKR